jgi:predicted nucleotidyltransferase
MVLVGILRKPKDRDFIRTKEDLLFCVVGYSHPPDRLLSYLKYVPGDGGLWASGNQHFERMIPFYSSKVVSNTFSFLKERYPQYLFYSPVNGITFSAVPYSEIKEYYEPEQKLRELAGKRSGLDELQQKAVGLAGYLSTESGVPLDKFGVTGSILLGIHNVSISDVDLTIYGRNNALHVKRILIQDYGKYESSLRQLSKDESSEWCKKKTRQFSIDYQSAKSILKRKWNFGYYKGKAFSVHPTKLDTEITERYGEPQFIAGENVEIIATVEDNTQAIFNPSTYKVKEVQILHGPAVTDLEEVVSFEGVFSDIASPNEKIKVKGKLELVTNTGTGGKYHRVVVGSDNLTSPEHILPIH